MAVSEEESGSVASSVRSQKAKKNKVQEKVEEKQLVKTQRVHSQLLEKVLNTEYQRRGTGPVSEDMIICLQVLQQLKKNPNADPFLQRVNAHAQSCPDYYDIIKDPMDLQRVEQNLKQGIYQTRKQFVDDVNKIWKNSFTYNKEGSQIYKMTLKMSKFFDQAYAEAQNLLTRPISPDSSEMNKKLGDSTKLEKAEQEKVDRLENQKQIPLSQEEKSWVYQNVTKLNQTDTAYLCAMIKDFCLVSNDSMELNLDSLPVNNARQVKQFIESKILLTPPPQQVLAISPSDAVNKKKKRIGKLEKMDIPLTINEKKQLGLNIRLLPAEDLTGIWSIVQDGQQYGEMIEFDIDTLPVRKARELEAYVKDKTAQQAKKQAVQKAQQQLTQQQHLSQASLSTYDQTVCSTSPPVIGNAPSSGVPSAFNPQQNVPLTQVSPAYMQQKQQTIQQTPELAQKSQQQTQPPLQSIQQTPQIIQQTQQVNNPQQKVNTLPQTHASTYYPQGFVQTTSQGISPQSFNQSQQQPYPQGFQMQSQHGQMNIGYQGRQNYPNEALPSALEQSEKIAQPKQQQFLMQQQQNQQQYAQYAQQYNNYPNNLQNMYMNVPRNMIGGQQGISSYPASQANMMKQYPPQAVNYYTVQQQQEIQKQQQQLQQQNLPPYNANVNLPGQSAAKVIAQQSEHSFDDILSGKNISDQFF